MKIYPKILKVNLSEIEKDRIIELSKKAGISISAYGRIAIQKQLEKENK